MKYLLDTHALLWSLFCPEKLGSFAREILEDAQAEVFVSAVCYWEISLKFALGKLELPGTSPDEIPSSVARIGFKETGLDAKLLSTFHLLERNPEHRDPFDRLLVWQALSGGFALISKDRRLGFYAAQGLKALW